ncbi:MAG: lipopolysaccharide biosynthesis protein [Nitrospiraceae bacterium]
MLRILVGIGTLQGLAVLVNFARTKITALLVGPEGVGIISVIDQLIQFVAHTCALSLPFAAVKFLSKAHSEGGEAFREGYVLFFKALLVLSSIGTVVAVSLALLRIDLFPKELTSYSTLLVVGFLGIPGTVLAGFFPNVLAAGQQPTGSARLTLYVGMTVASASTVGLAMGGLLGLYAGSAAAVTIVAVATVGYLRQILGLAVTRSSAALRVGFHRLGNVVSFSILFYVSALTSTGALLVARYVVLENFGEAEAGFLQAGMAIALLMNVVLNPLNGLFLTPQVNRASSKEEKFQTAVEFQKQLAMILMILALPMVLFPHIILWVAFSSKFLVVAPYVFLFVLWQAFVNLGGVYQALLIGLDDMVSYTALTCLGNLLAAGAVVLLAPRYGVVGAAIGLAVASALVSVGTFVRLRLRHGFGLPGTLVSLMSYSLLVMFAFGVVFRHAGDWNLTTVFSKIGVALLAVMGLLLFLNRKDKLALSAISHKMWPGT